ncbi:MAG: MoaD/ThiS family protein [Candidatus Odinarchaeota archaeon]
MKVKIKLYATLRSRAPVEVGIGEAFELNVDNDTNIVDLLTKLNITDEDVKIVMVNGESVDDLQKSLKSEDLVVIFPPVGGG